MDKIQEILTRGVANIIPSKDELEKALRSGKKLNIYLGIDPTSTRLHLGHTVALRKLQQLADLGHNVTFLIGDFTALIGDTSDKESERPTLTPEQIKENFQTYKKQAEKVINFSKVTIRFNSEWLSKLTFEEIVKLMQHFSLGDFIGRELIKKRLTDGKRIGLHEAVYPVMQGYDSYFMDTELQIGGTDQTFNMQAGRTLQKDIRQKESFVLTTPILEGTDGRKMSKSFDNAIWLEDNPSDMYAKVMSIKDILIVPYLTLVTNVVLSDVESADLDLKSGNNPINIKKKLAYQIVAELYEEDTAQKAQNDFEKIVQNKELPQDIETLTLAGIEEINIVDLLTYPVNNIPLVSSKSEAKRLVEQGGVEVDNVKITNPSLMIKIQNNIVKIGKRRFLRLNKAE